MQRAEQPRGDAAYGQSSGQTSGKRAAPRPQRSADPTPPPVLPAPVAQSAAVPPPPPPASAVPAAPVPQAAPAAHREPAPPAADETQVANQVEWYREEAYADPRVAQDNFGWGDPNATVIATPALRGDRRPRPEPDDVPEAEQTQTRQPIAYAAPAAPAYEPEPVADEMHEAHHDGGYPPRRSRRQAPVAEPDPYGAAAYETGYDDGSYDVDYVSQGYDDYESRHGLPEDDGRRGVSVWQVLSSTLIVLAIVVALFSAYSYRHTVGQINGDDSANDVLKKVDTGPHEPINVLVMGVDDRGCDGCGVDGAEASEGSDTTILLHLSANRKFAYGVSIPRDTMVDRPACRGSSSHKLYPAASYKRWNSAYSLGGAKCTIKQLTEVSKAACPKCKVDVNHFVVVNFGSFKKMVDAVDGVKVCLPEEVNDSVAHIHFKKGVQTLRGKRALDYVRVRHGIGDGSDTDRTKRQQAFIGSMMAKALSNDTLSSPTKVLSFLNAAMGGLTMDSSLKGSLGTMAKIGTGFKDIGMDNIKFLTVPVVADPQNPTATLVLDKENAANVWRAIAADKPLTKKIAAGSLDAAQTPAGKKAAKKKAATKPTDGASAGGAPSAAPSAAPSGSPSAKKQAELDQIAAETKKRNELAGLCT